MNPPLRFPIPAIAALAAVVVAVGVRGDFGPQRARIGEFTLVYNVNNSGYIDVCGCKHKKVRNGSLTRRSSFLKQLRSTGRSLLLLDGGSSLFSVSDQPLPAAREEEIRKARLIVEAYGRMGYRAMALGVSDIAMGLDTLKELLEKAQFDVLSANFLDGETRKPIFKPYAVYEVNGVRVGVIGLTLDSMGTAYLAKVAPGVVLGDPIATARRLVPELREKSDVIIALSHIKQESNYELMRQIGDIGVVIDPYIEFQNHRTWIDENDWLGVLDETLFLRSDGQGARLGVLDIAVDHSGAKLRHRYFKEQLETAVAGGSATPEQKAELAVYGTRNLYTFERVSIGPHHQNDPDIDNLIDEWKKGIDPSRVAHLEKELPMRDRYLTVDGCKGCHETQHEFWLETGHAHAMESLAETGDQHRYDCVACHSLGYGTAYLDTSKIGAWANVQCESCHGDKPEHAKDPARHRFGPVAEITCLGCHNEEHTLKEFHFLGMKRKAGCPKG